MTIKQLNKGDYFTLKEVNYPHDAVVWVRGEYDRGTKKYMCYKFDDIFHERAFKGDKEVFTNFIF